MRPIVVILLAALSLGGCRAQAMAALGESPQDATVAAALANARMLVRSRAYEQAEDALQSAVHGQMLAEFSPERRYEVLSLYAMSAWWGRDYEQAHWAYVRVTEEPTASDDDWQGRLMSAATVGDTRDAYAAFDHLRQAAPAAVQVINVQLLEVLAYDFRTLDNAAQAQTQLADVLSAGVRDDPRGELSPLWLQAAAAALQAGDSDRAAKYARRIDDPAVLIELRADRRFDALVAADPAAFDPHALAERNLAQATAASKAPSGRLAATYRQASALYQLGRYAEAVQAIDAALADGPAWGEDPSLSSSLVGRKATMLSKLGRDAEAIALTQAQCAVCGGFETQEARLMLGAGRPADAVEVLEHNAGQVVGLAATDMAALRACGYQRLGRGTEAAALLKPLIADARRNPDATLGALLCAGSDADVTAGVTAMLADPMTRPEMLGALQTYHEGKLPPLTRALRERLARLAATPAVKSEIDRVGRIAAYDMPRYAIVG